jgi:hypothetical protein
MPGLWVLESSVANGVLLEHHLYETQVTKDWEWRSTSQQCNLNPWKRQFTLENLVDGVQRVLEAWGLSSQSCKMYLVEWDRQILRKRSSWHYPNSWYVQI